MAKKTETTPIAQATATLPEGATVSVSRFGGKRPFIEIRAWREGAIVKMRGDDVSPHNLQAYLNLTIQAINRERAKHVVKPPEPATRPYDIPSFVLHMCRYDMFLFETLDNDDGYNEETGHCATVVEAPTKKKRKRKAKGNP